MSRAALAAAVLSVAALAAGMLWLARPDALRHSTGLTRIAFLDNLSDEDVMLLLHPLATGGGPRAVLDPAAIRAAQARAYYLEDPGAQPGGEQSDSAFVSIIRNGMVETAYRCATDACSSGSQGFAGLLEASQPVERISEDFAHHEAARKRHWKLLNDPTTLLIVPPNLPAPSTRVYPAQVRLDLPTIMAGEDATRQLDMVDYRARFTAAFAHAFPDAEAYRLGDISLRHHESEGVTLLEPAISIEVIPSLRARLLQRAPFADLPEFTPVLALPDADIPLLVPSVDAITVTEIAPVSYTLTYYRIASDEPSAQQ